MPQSTITALRELAGQIEVWRQSRGLSKNALCQRYGQLGSTKTYGRILSAEDPLDQLDADGQLENYRAAWELMQLATEDPEATRLYSHWEWVRQALLSITEALDDPGLCRLVLITGGPGAGKSSLLDLLATQRQTAAITYRVEATEAWRESPNALLGDLLLAVGGGDRAAGDAGPRQLPPGPHARLRALVDRLDSRRLILAIDEAHHIGPAGYNIVKTIINQTRAVVVMTAIPELIARINKASHAEAAQLFVNRLSEHVRLSAPEAGDVLDFAKRKGIKFADPQAAAAISAKIAADARASGLWRFISRCVREALKSPQPLTVEAFANALVRVKRSISLA